MSSPLYHDPFWDVTSTQDLPTRPPIAKVRDLLYGFRRLVDSHRLQAHRLLNAEADIDDLIDYAQRLDIALRDAGVTTRPPTPKIRSFEETPR